MRRFIRYGLILGTLLCSGVLAAQPSLPGPPDVRANVMKMLEEARLRGETTGLTPGEVAEYQRAVTGVEGATAPSAEPDLFDRLQGEVPPASDRGSVPEVKSGVTPEARPEGEAERPAAPPVAPPAVTDDSPHLLLPQKEITIRDLNDLKRLSREFQDARERKP